MTNRELQNIAEKPDGGSTRAAESRFRFPSVAAILLLTTCCFWFPARSLGQSKAENPRAAAQQSAPSLPVQRPKLPEPDSSPPSSATTASAESPLSSDWAPELLYAILNSPNPDAAEALYDAAFAAGPALIPRLQAALKDDRTAEFAAQSLAYVGGAQSLDTLAKLTADRRDLGLQRFYYGSLGEYRSPEATKVLLYALDHSDAEPDRTVTEAAILAFTVRSDPSLIPQMRQAESKITDVVIRDDLENAMEVIQSRARYLASPEGRRAGASIELAVRTYFIPALESVPGAGGVKQPEKHSAAAGVKAEVQSVTLSADKTRALAHVVFEDASALANYDIVLQKQAGDWTLASVWLGTEVEKESPDTGKPK